MTVKRAFDLPALKGSLAYSRHLSQVYVFHVEVHPQFTWYTQCVTFNSFPSEAWQTAYMVFGIVMIYLVPLVIIIVTYAIILITLIKKSQSNQAGKKYCNLFLYSSGQRTQAVGGSIHCTAGLQFYKFGFNCFTTYQ